jgi:hypothetical protein
MSDSVLPNDRYSREQARLLVNPAAVTLRSGSTLNLTDYYGNAETWVVNTIRIDGADTVFLQRVNAEGGVRFVVPPEVVAAIRRQGDSLSTVSRRRGASKALDTKREAGIPVGNPAALAKARARRADRVQGKRLGANK